MRKKFQEKLAALPNILKVAGATADSLLLLVRSKTFVDMLERVYYHKRDADYRKEDDDSYKSLKKDNKATHNLLLQLKSNAIENVFQMNESFQNVILILNSIKEVVWFENDEEIPKEVKDNEEEEAMMTGAMMREVLIDRWWR
ncbi:hypothetical protein LIER_41021 [Lithospermum erythrorhizon]|uniref:Uncharacterized protein n=1 Tax=Lithospermum erythrorhizon TaxID=34254 RepID=A0AAV3R353_LITER